MHDEAVAFLEEYMEMFVYVSINTGKQEDMFQSVQAGVLTTTASALRIQPQLLSAHEFNFVLLCLLTQNALENLFFCIQSSHLSQRALEFKLMLLVIILIQFFKRTARAITALMTLLTSSNLLRSRKQALKNEAAENELLIDNLLVDDALYTS